MLSAIVYEQKKRIFTLSKTQVYVILCSSLCNTVGVSFNRIETFKVSAIDSFTSEHTLYTKEERDRLKSIRLLMVKLASEYCKRVNKTKILPSFIGGYKGDFFVRAKLLCIVLSI